MEIKCPAKPILIWDGDCGFCAHWIRRWEGWVGDAVEYRPYQEVLGEFPQVEELECRKAVQLVLTDGSVLSAAHAVLKSLSLGGRAPRLLAAYEHSAVCRWIMETGYRFVAANRSWLPQL
jgi:predicted DCC family thiol-disulfide oxidoreductase YuxK